MFFQELQIDPDDLVKLLATDHDGFYQYMQHYYTRKFYIGDTGINRKTLKDWEASELLPYTYREEGWRKFSFVEWVWLECINEFRKLGVSIEKINTVKKALFEVDPEELFPLFQDAIQTFPGKIDKKESIASTYSHPELTKEIRSQVVQESQMSPFLLFVMATVISKENICIVYNNHDYCSIFVMGTTDDNIRKDNQDVFENLINDSFMVINMRNVINNLFQKTEHRNESFVIDFLSPKEKKIFDHIRTSNAKEITITFDKNNEPTHIKVNRNQISKETLNKVARYLKRGNYQTVEFTTRDGHLIKYEEQDSIRLE
jgi:DNA-binding transcriptional MerR regulator